MQIRATSLTALACSVAATLAFAVTPPSADPDSTSTGPVPPMATDAAGDANALNGQGLEDAGSTATPVQVDEADILHARITSTWRTTRGADGLLDRHFTGVEFRTALGRVPGPDSVPVLHRFIGTIDGCETWVQFAAGANGGAEHGTASVRQYGTGCGIPDDPDTGLRGSRTFDGEGISWSWDPETGEALVTVTAADVDPVLGDTLVPGAVYLLEELHVRHYSPAGFTAPVIDEMAGQHGYAYLGEDVPADQQPGEGGGHTGGDGNGVVRDTTPVCGRYDAATDPGDPIGDDRTGVTASTLTLGIHAPATGSAPLPTTSFEHGSDLYWRTVTEDCGETVLGRTAVDVLFADDKYDPNSAGQVCQQLAAQAFLVLGTTGTDQIQRCAQLAEVSTYPYLSTGVTEAGLHGNPWYFATTMSHRQQGGLLAEYAAVNPDGLAGLGDDAVYGAIVTGTSNFDDALEGWLQGADDNGLTVAQQFRPTRNDSSWYAATAREFKEAGVDTIYWVGSPIALLDFSRTASQSFGYDPRYVGPWQDTARDAVLAAGCDTTGKGLDGGIWLSPTPGLDAAPTAFLEAAEVFGTPDDDVALSLWAAAEQQHELLAAYGQTVGTDLTREEFRRFVEDGTSASAGTYPVASWSPDDHFGGEAMHVVQANCGLQEHVTLHLDAAGF